MDAGTGHVGPAVIGLPRQRGPTQKRQRGPTQNMEQDGRILTANERLGHRRESGYHDLALRVPWPGGHTRR
jgi:hypothetical protein